MWLPWLAANLKRITQIDVEGGATVAMMISPLFSLHSDRHRKLSIETPTGRRVNDPVEDTGWWRGRNLYRHASGIYVLYEGQAGCVLRRGLPHELVKNSAISAIKPIRP
ncbi:hypothetical protein [Paracoccus sp. S1E-3]|uniref:hypothetical protein n=1 Tax=Paracoccus sp. S1E-3 TaxID=2756130 RepID=UPI0015EF9D00|nr:hypothetical protein [Paracoccus sp. S1E-3]MBA4492261.1 hypothetical protein [Paracoccus sp. S1E-3]